MQPGCTVRNVKVHSLGSLQCSVNADINASNVDLPLSRFCLKVKCETFAKKMWHENGVHICFLFAANTMDKGLVGGLVDCNAIGAPSNFSDAVSDPNWNSMNLWSDWERWATNWLGKKPQSVLHARVAQQRADFGLLRIPPPEELNKLETKMSQEWQCMVYQFLIGHHTCTTNKRLATASNGKMGHIMPSALAHCQGSLWLKDSSWPDFVEFNQPSNIQRLQCILQEAKKQGLSKCSAAHTGSHHVEVGGFLINQHLQNILPSPVGLTYTKFQAWATDIRSRTAIARDDTPIWHVSRAHNRPLSSFSELLQLVTEFIAESIGIVTSVIEILTTGKTLGNLWQCNYRDSAKLSCNEDTRSTTNTKEGGTLVSAAIQVCSTALQLGRQREAVLQEGLTKAINPQPANGYKACFSVNNATETC
ncbi:uncharacterized protein C8Q71DRAFT_722449 [Rhodofomes roseus]|uniref:Uncharacterized protein n=1 Tax=Rhodofomes roseus TaxID=34475 RepID=A0ABQ8KMM6_9APHY|nr:uncharacterized protein C8Q71DRAFT_722449 [Rhodofomes roseus]KAH9839569.1 hypothetical protein C8Q71DRAFT_722449 [Rhodofomes roseus]